MRARYRVYMAQEVTAGGNPWVEMPEAEPLTRARLRDIATDDTAFVVVEDDGQLSYDPAQVEVDASVYSD